MYKLCVALVGASLLIAAGCGGPALAPNHVLSLRLAQDEKATGLKERRLESSGETIFIEPKPLVRSEEFERVWITEDEKGRPALQFEINRTGAARLGAATASNAGKKIAIVAAGKVLYALEITDPFSKTFQVTGDFEDGEIDTLYSSFTGHE